MNVAALTSKIVYVRFNFGMEKQSITLNTTIARAPGIVPNTNIQVLVVNMNSKPFNNMRLGYDLYDYNDYTDPSKEVVNDPRDGGLYCRGLLLEDDPTFVPTTQQSQCDGTLDAHGVALKCLYSYAKITDATLYSNQSVLLNGITTIQNLTSIPTRPQVWSNVNSVRSPSYSTQGGSVCLPDSESPIPLNQLFDINLAGLTTGLPMPTPLPVGYTYNYPFRSINDTAWQISGSAIFNATTGLFTTSAGSLLYPKIGYHSLLFPRASKLQLPQGNTYLGSSDRFGDLIYRTKQTSDSTGTTQYTDGCNSRAMNYDPASSESIGSCNVNSSIEVFYLQDGKEVNITTDKTIKLQLIRPDILNYQGKDVLTTSFKRCDSSATCGTDECCFNNRCWSKDLVTQCVDATPIVGNQAIGSSCTSDYECSSLCCNQSTGSCQPHDPNGVNPVLCNKPAGQQCVSQEFCAQQAVVTCKIVKIGFKPNGSVACVMRCPAVMTYGTCTSGACVPPSTPAVPTNSDGTPFNGSDCSQAVDP